MQLPARVVTALILGLLLASIGQAAVPKALQFEAVQTGSSSRAAGYASQERLMRGGRRVGTGSVSCTYTPKNTRLHSGANCRLRFTLAGGTINASGSVSFESNRSMLRIIGGTGSYLGVNGSGTVKDLKTGTTAVTLTLKP